jgi:hypothetical protein
MIHFRRYEMTSWDGVSNVPEPPVYLGFESVQLGGRVYGLTVSMRTTSSMGDMATLDRSKRRAVFCGHRLPLVAWVLRFVIGCAARLAWG